MSIHGPAAGAAMVRQPPDWADYASCARNQDYASAVELVGSRPRLRRHFSVHLRWSPVGGVDLDWYAAAQAARTRTWSPADQHLLDLVLFLVRPELEHDCAPGDSATR